MRKLKISWLFVFFLVWTIFSVTASAEEFDADRYGTLTIHYTKEGIDFPDIEVQAYRIAKMDTYGKFQLRVPYSGYPIDVNHVKTQQQWKNIATTLVGYIQADDLAPDTMSVTDENGMVKMDNMRTGLYLIPGTTVEVDGMVYTFESFFVYMPMRDKDGAWNYDVEAKPKCSVSISPEIYTVKIIWLDAGYEHKRPASAMVEIYHAGSLQEIKELSDQNDWFYRWEVPSRQRSRSVLRALPVTQTGWSVVQTGVPEYYDVSINLKGHDFTIINVYTEQGGDNPGSPEKPENSIPSDKPPGTSFGAQALKTGDAANAEIYMMLLALAGIGLLIIGIYRNKKHEKKKD